MNIKYTQILDTPFILLRQYITRHATSNDLTSIDSGLSVWISHCVLPGVGVGARVSCLAVVLVRSRPQSASLYTGLQRAEAARHNTGSRLFWASRTTGACRKDSIEYIDSASIMF